ncbi:peroxidase family protein [Sedimentitalea sp.]|uniref:peroxidase family protein n=1 Tax=Sedimentitalea sp. TaxID=2048915 RepID=UPI003299CE84
MAVKLNRHDLEFILDQIKISEAHAAGTPLGDLLAQPHLPYGLRTVDGTYNNIIPGRETWGAAEQIMPRFFDPSYNNENDGDEQSMGPMGPDPVTNTDYGVVGEGTAGANGGHTGNVADADPRIISNLIVDQTLRNPAAITAALQHAEFDGDLSQAVADVRALYQTYLTDASADPTNTAAIDALKVAIDQQLLDDFGIEMDGNSISLPNVATDEGLSAPFNGWMTFFGQFFDHGLDLIGKGKNGTIFVPLAADDPLRTHGPDGIADSGDEVPPEMAFMALTRLDPEIGPGEDGVLGTADDTADAKNKTTPFVDQNQTYTSHPSHQVFLREYEMVNDVPLATGNLLNGVNGGLATWADVKTQAQEKLGIQLDDRDIFGVPLILTDLYGEFIRGDDGFPQVIINIGPDLIPNTADDVTVSGAPGDPVVLAELNNGLGPVRTAHAFLDDIAHNAVPVLFDNPVDGLPAILQADPDIGTDEFGNAIPSENGQNIEYDNELLDQHFLTGDGRGNENIGLTAVHHVFHAEHNRQVEATKAHILEIVGNGDQEEDLEFLNEWLLSPVNAGFDANTLQWDGERLFQTARFSTEMQYQHLVFEEFGRKIQPLIDVFVFNTVTDVDPAIFAEFAHTVYRFGHSMLTDHLKLLPLNDQGQPVDAEGNVVDTADWGVDVGLIEAFLNPVLFDDNGSVSAEQAAGAIIRGMTYVQGNEIDEFVVESLRNNLLGLPLDLAAINIARGRDAGVPTLNDAREQLYAASNSSWLKPYDSWADFAASLKTPASIVNFIAAYGTHPTILASDSLEEKREAAMILLGLTTGTDEEAAALGNASFEMDSLADGVPGVTTHVDGNYTATAPDGWTISGGAGGLIAPEATIVDQTGPSGDNVAWLREGAILAQTTTTVVEADANYRLTFDIGDRLDMDWPGGEARLMAGTTEIATLSLAAPGADGGWSTVSLETGDIDPLLVGETLSIEIQQGDGTTNQIFIDNVQLDILRPADAPADRFDYLNSVGAWENEETGLNLIDLWIGGLAERVMPFGGMLGSTFNAVFELQMENLQEGDRFYYLSRTQGLNMLNELENNAFTKLIMANTDIGNEDGDVDHHIGLDVFAKYDHVLEVNPDNQIEDDPEGDDPVLNALLPKVLRDDPTTPGADTNYIRYTGGEHVVFGGTEEADTIIAGDGDDAIWGGSGDDVIEGGHGVDLITSGEGDDIVTDMGDSDDFIKGEGGDDVIANSNGLDVVMGGPGKDVILVGVDATDVFGGEGDDFILGGLDHDFLMGNEGSDWIEGGDGFDVISGDNSELFFNSTILGHDVMFAGANENDFDAESGDDIMVQGESVMRNEGMHGFDWAIHKGSPVAANSDMRIPIFTTVFDDILRDRFDQVEALSGWDLNDVLRGDDRGSGEEIEVEFSMEDHFLSQAGVNRIDGLRELLGLDDYTPDNPDVDMEQELAWTGGNVLIGGDGNDLLEGRGGDDFIHGDAWLNVRISIRDLDGQGNVTDTEIHTVDSLTQELTISGVTKTLSNFLLSGELKPKQLQIVREIKYAEDVSDDTDTAIFAGNQDWYEITHVGDRTYVARRELEEVDPQISEGTDTLVGIERIMFADGLYTIRETGNHDPVGRLTIEGLPAIEDGVLTVNALAITDANNSNGMIDPDQITYRWQIERNDGTGDYIDIPNVSGNSFTPGDDHVGLRIRVIGTYTDDGGVIEIVSSYPTDTVINVPDDPVGDLLISDMSPTEGQEVTATVAFDDPDGITDAFEEGLLTYQWQYSADGSSNWIDVPGVDGGNDRTFAPGPDVVGNHLRMMVVYEDDGADTHTVYSAVTQIVGNHIDSDTSFIDDLSGDAEGGTTIGDDWVEGGGGANNVFGGDGNDVINGGAGADELNGEGGNDTITGGPGSDTIDGGEGNDTIVYGVNHGNDVIDGGAGVDTLRIVQAGMNSADVINVVMAGGEISQVNGAQVDNVENLEIQSGGGSDTLNYSTSDNVSVNLLSGAATGFSLARGLTNVMSGTGNDTLTGNSEANALDGGAGNDTLRGGFGDDNLQGGQGDNLLYGEAGDDLLSGGDASDRFDGGVGTDTVSYASASATVDVTLETFEEQDTVGAGIDRLVDVENLIGSAFDDTLTGDGDHNLLDGGAGADLMTGGDGDDTYVVDNAGDVVVEEPDGGTDTIHSALEGYQLVDNIEDLVLIGGVIEGLGNTLDNRLTGNEQDNILDGMDGSDAVVLPDHVTNYTFSISGGTLSVSSDDGGTDALLSIERAEIEGHSYDIVHGTNGSNILAGGAGADLLLGLNNADTLTGNGGNDILIGGNGNNDVMLGGTGDDTYVVEQSGDLVDETGGDGIDTIFSTVTRNLNNSNHALGDVENVTLIGGANRNALGNNLDNVLIGNGGSNTLQGRAGADELFGMDGDDNLVGNNGDDILAGGDGNDNLNGGNGNADVAVFDGAVGDYVFGISGGGLSTVTDIVGDGGVDTLSNIEYLRFGGIDGEDLSVLNADGDATAADPSIIFGSIGDDTIIGSEGNDVIIGGPGNDTLNGHDVGDGDDDVVAQLADDDIFLWSPGDGTDLINGGGEGVEGDLFQIIGNGQTEAYRIYTYDEAVIRIAFAGSDETEIVVTRQVEDEDEVIIAELTEIEEIVVNGEGISGNTEASGDTVEMYGSFDVATSLRPDTITILGSSGDDQVDISSLLSEHRIVFKGAGGNDTIIGTLRPQDVVELLEGKTIEDYTSVVNPDGSTTISTEGHSVTFRGGPVGEPEFLAPEDIPDDGTNGQETGSESPDSVNEPAEPEANDQDPEVTDEGQTLSGGTDADALVGGDGADILTGMSGADLLNGGAGRDILFGGEGNDDMLGGAGSDMLYGDAGNDRMFGGEGADLLDGGTGNDTVFGGDGDDVFVAAAGDGNDTYYGDDLGGGSGIDTIDMSAVMANVQADLGTGFGGRGGTYSEDSGSDTLWGVENIITGGGDDQITASSAVNVMDGNTGDDNFSFLNAGDADGDTISGFEPGDRIDLSGMDADETVAGNQSFTLVSGGFTGAGQIMLSQETREDGSYTVISGNTTGEDAADFRINVRTHNELNESQFAF